MGLIEFEMVLRIGCLEKSTCGYLSADWASSGVLALVGEILHRGRHEAVRSEQVTLQTLKNNAEKLLIVLPNVLLAWKCWNSRRQLRLRNELNYKQGDKYHSEVYGFAVGFAIGCRQSKKGPNCPEDKFKCRGL